ncbi:MAG TPA: EAL domain-containing protein, partial [Solirubrobacteraceae bacterium]|nr:EAL domain-containing protein [Solirubrobacteraceae bacterium]
WVLEEACAQAAHWTAAHRGEQAFVIAVNLSPVQLTRSEFTDDIKAAIELTGDPPACLWLEVTENAVLEQMASTITTLEAIKALGAKIVLDDFGTGYASLQSLRRFPIDGVKIDKSFIAGLARNRSDLAIVSGIADIAAGLGLQVVAEGVETAQQVQVLRDLNCPLVQGMHFSGPVAPEEVPGLLARGAL